jgi:hypothetical protein
MRCGKQIVLFVLLTASLGPFGISQLRNISEYTQDRINMEQTYFMLRDSGEAGFAWASEWTTATAYGADGKSAILVWHFKDGSKAYSQQGEGIAEFGKNTGYLIVNKAKNLEDIHRKKIQPLTRNNYPVRIELWIGEIGDITGYSSEVMGDAACFKAAGIENNISYHFSRCQAGEKEGSSD